jgi:hypothetical protein
MRSQNNAGNGSPEENEHKLRGVDGIHYWPLVRLYFGTGTQGKRGRAVDVRAQTRTSRFSSRRSQYDAKTTSLSLTGC